MAEDSKCYVCDKGLIAPEGWIGAAGGGNMEPVTMHEYGRCSNPQCKTKPWVVEVVFNRATA
jgi:hypothetical protein